MKKIFIIHPEDSTTSFLNRIKNNLVANHSDIIHHFNVKPNQYSKNKCLETISKLPKNSFVIFLGHGRSDGLHGSKGKLYENKDLTSQYIIDENPDQYYYDHAFIDTENIGVFKDKNIFCLACNSNSKIASYAIEANATSFLGFGDIPTSISEFKDNYKNVSTDLVKMMKTEINYIIKTSLHIAIKKNLSIEGLLDHIKFISNQRISEILVHQKWNKDRYILCDNIYFLKNEATVFGDKKSKLYY